MGGFGKPPRSETQEKPQLCFHLKTVHPSTLPEGRAQKHSIYPHTPLLVVYVFFFPCAKAKQAASNSQGLSSYSQGIFLEVD